mgnify:CR=1 FL=1
MRPAIASGGWRLDQVGDICVSWHGNAALPAGCYRVRANGGSLVWGTDAAHTDGNAARRGHQRVSASALAAGPEQGGQSCGASELLGRSWVIAGDLSEERMMRVHALVALAGGAAVLVACSGGPQQVDASAPTVTYSYKNEAELRDAR